MLGWLIGLVMFLVVIIAAVITIQHVLYGKVTIVTVDHPTQSGVGQKSDTSAILTVPDSTTTDHVPGGIINMGYSKETFQIVGKDLL